MKTLVACLLLMAASIDLRADGGVILNRQVVNGLDITVFASPVPLRAGPVDISVLVQKEGSTKAVLDADVEIAWSALSSASPDWLPPCCSMDKADGKNLATRAHSQNKLFYSAFVPVKSSGPSEIVVRVKTPESEAMMSVDIEAGPPKAPVLAYWPWLVLPPFSIVLFTLHQRLGRKRSHSSS